MLNKVKIFVLLFFVFSMLLPTGQAVYAESSQNQMKFKDFYLDVWPEYDDPRVLVILKGTFVNDSKETVKQGEFVYFNIPTDAEIGMACETDANFEAHACQQFGVENKGDYQVLRWRITKDINPGQEYPVFLEYYYNPIKGNPNKTIDFNFIPSANIDKLELSVQQPLKASNFVLDPVAPSQENEQGFTYHLYSYNNVSANNALEVSIGYTKQDSNPSVQRVQPSSSNQGQTQFPDSSSGNNVWLYAVGTLVVVMAVIFIRATGFSKKKTRVHRITQKSGQKLTKEQSKERREIKEMFLHGQISEDTYRELMDDLEH